MDFYEEYDPLTKCPFCGVSEPKMTQIHGEFIPECCGELPAFVETQDPAGETGLMIACFDREAALIDWQGCVEFALRHTTQEAA